MNMDEKSRENRVRRAARRQGYLLLKSKRRDRRAEDYGLYVLVPDSRGNVINRGGAASVSAFARGEGIALDWMENIVNWDRVHLVPEEDYDAGPYPTDVALLESSLGAWHLMVGLRSPDDHDFGSSELSADEALAYSREYLRNWRDNFA